MIPGVTREEFFARLLGLAALPLAACSDAAVASGDVTGVVPFDRVAGQATEVHKTEAEWRALLSPEAFAVLFEEATEPPGSSPLNAEHGDGTFLCAACLIPLFRSAEKYDSGTGWPSFYDAPPGSLEFKEDLLLSVPRTEYHCRRCGGHQGHVFDDGPPPTGKRYCNNGLALQFVRSGDPLPAPRT